MSGLIVFGLIFVSCKSKFNESSPDSVTLSGIPLEERAKLKEKVDVRIDSIQQGAERTKKIIDMFRKVQDPKNQADVYTPIDFLIDINNEIKNQIPENGENGKLIRKGKIKLPFTSLTEDCQTVETMLESEVIKKEDGGDIKVAGDKLTYHIKTCASNGSYLPTILASWNGRAMQFQVDNSNLTKLFNNILRVENLKTSTCQFKNNDKNIIESMACKNFEIRLSNSEAAHILTMNFDNDGDVRFEASADIFENQNKKAISSIRVLSNGDVQFKVKKLDGAQLEQTAGAGKKE